MSKVQATCHEHGHFETEPRKVQVVEDPERLRYWAIMPCPYGHTFDQRVSWENFVRLSLAGAQNMADIINVEADCLAEAMGAAARERKHWWDK